jgi:preprotein translocase subunit SecB
MADQDSPTGGNGSAEPGNEPRVTVHAQYIKDLSVENPSSPQVYQWQVQPALDVQFNINVENLSPELHEIILKIDVSARSENGVHFVVDLSYGGLFEIHGVPDEAIPPLLLIEAPRLIFPFARQVIADAVANTGFPPLLLDPIDFAGAYMAQLQAQQQQLQSDGGENPGGSEASGGGESVPPQEEPQPQ